MKSLLKVFAYLFIFFITVNFRVYSQTERSLIYKAFISGNMGEWKNVMDNFAKKDTLTPEQTKELIGYYYGYIGYQIGVHNKDEANVYLGKGESIIDDQLKLNPNSADLFAYKGAFIGFKIGISPLKAPFIGRLSVRNVNRAIELDPDNIQANIEKANVLYYSPSAFGGDKTEAKKYYQKAITLFERNSLATQENWLYLTVMTSLAQIYTNEKSYLLAKELYEKILLIEPSYVYVKDELYPAVLKNSN